MEVDLCLFVFWVQWSEVDQFSCSTWHYLTLHLAKRCCVSDAHARHTAAHCFATASLKASWPPCPLTSCFPNVLLLWLDGSSVSGSRSSLPTKCCLFLTRSGWVFLGGSWLKKIINHFIIQRSKVLWPVAFWKQQWIGSRWNTLQPRTLFMLFTGWVHPK